MLRISTDKSLLDRPFIQGFLSTTYWAEGRTPEQMDTIIEHSLNFGMYLNDKQIGYARVLSDYVQFAYVMDVFVDPAYRGKGYSKELMTFITEYESLRNINLWRLATRDAHGLYEQFGFGPLANPENLMERVKQPKR